MSRVEYVTVETLLPADAVAAERGYRLAGRQAELVAAAEIGYELVTSVTVLTKQGTTPTEHPR